MCGVGLKVCLRNFFWHSTQQSIYQYMQFKSQVKGFQKTHHEAYFVNKCTIDNRFKNELSLCV